MSDELRHLSAYPIRKIGETFYLSDLHGRRISFHRTKSGALRRRRELTCDQDHMLNPIKNGSDK